MKRIVILGLLLFSVIALQAQKLTVEKMEVAPMDLSASTQPRNDLNGNPCALVKVQLAAGGASFEGNIIGDVAYSKGEYWVYMSAGSYMLNIKHGSFVPLFVNFRDYDIKKVEGKTTYVLTLLLPQSAGSQLSDKTKLVVNYKPVGAEIWMEGRKLGTSPDAFPNFKPGSYKVEIRADGYQSKTLDLVVIEGQTAQLTGSLTANANSEFEGLTAREIEKTGSDYFFGRNGKEKDQEIAVKWYRQAAGMGNAWAQQLLGYAYENGLGVLQDYHEAMKWYRRAAEQGNARAQFLLGYGYRWGHGVAQDYEEAVKWFQKSAEKGDIYAQFNLGVCYAYGTGVAQDYAEAVKWYRRGAEKGSAPCQYNLGMCYYKGNGVPQDDVEAFKWWKKAADQGDADAQNNVASCYEEGQGVKKNIEEAVIWYQKAAEQGHKSAQKSLKKLGR